ncbi:hypothetical protein [Bacillus badius]|uniref:hypothetical protein n=1 Tax=Bacillus badius TaxID=1455 RepID=UPI0005ADE1EE|nr:hypothetical protein [Bacillus badius]KIL74342.1 hypothetical protein SD78_1411 [Bacillus badius]
MGKVEIILKDKNSRRKKRSDAKHDVKFKLSLEDKKKLHYKAMDENLSITALSSLTVKRELIRENFYEDVEYENDGVFVHATFETSYYEMLKTLSVEMNMPIRRVVHRIIKNYLDGTIRHFEIFNYKENEGR